MRSEFDVVISGEPHLAVMLLIDTKSGIHFERIWSQTVARGRALTLGDFVEACIRFFKQNERPCLGFPMEVENDPLRSDCLISQTPVPRMISKSCRKVVHKEASDKVISCHECLSARTQCYGKITNTKFELKEEPESDIIYFTFCKSLFTLIISCEFAFPLLIRTRPKISLKGEFYTFSKWLKLFCYQNDWSYFVINVSLYSTLRFFFLFKCYYQRHMIFLYTHRYWHPVLYYS